MLFGAAGQAATMAVLAGCTSHLSYATGVGAATMLFLFNSFFAVGWLGMTWLYPAEITPLGIRAPANAISTTANWIFNFVIVMITPPAFATIGYQTYIIFAVINGALIFPVVYFFYPETAYRSLEEMDEIFHKSTGWFDVVKVANELPRRFGKNGELLINYEDTEEYAAHQVERRRSSVAASTAGKTKTEGDTGHVEHVHGHNEKL